MIILHDPQCADYGSSLRPEQPLRATRSVAHLRTAHPEWEWRIPAIATEDALLAVHTPAHLARLQGRPISTMTRRTSKAFTTTPAGPSAPRSPP